MSATNTPYGLRPINRTDGMPYAGATSQFLIDPAGLASNLFYGQVVIINHISCDFCYKILFVHNKFFYFPK